MTKREAERRAHQRQTLLNLGFTDTEAETLRRISGTLHRWHELECGTNDGHIERDEKTNKPMFYNARSRYVDPHDPRAWRSIPDRETAALRRLRAMFTEHETWCASVAPIPYGKIAEHGPCNCKINGRARLSFYIQTDPRGAALYILRPGDVPKDGDASAYYSRGICVY